MNRLIVDEAEAEERVFVEAITNQYESREAIKYLGGCLRLCVCLWVVIWPLTRLAQCRKKESKKEYALGVE